MFFHQNFKIAKLDLKNKFQIFVLILIIEVKLVLVCILI